MAQVRKISSNGYARVLILLAIGILILAGCASQQFRTQLFQRGEADGMGPNAMTWNGKDLVLAEKNMVVDVYNIDTGPYFGRESVYNSDGFFLYARDTEPMQMDMNICGLAWEGECCGKGFLWIADARSRELIKINRMNEIVKRLPTPGDNPSGLTFDGKSLWVSDSVTSRIYVVDPETGLVTREFKSPVAEPTGLSWDCKDVWVLGLDSCKSTKADCTVPRLVKLEVESGKVVSEIDLPKHIERPTSVVWVDGVIWVGDFVLNRVFKLSDKGKKIKDDTVYASEVTVTSRRIIAQKMEPEEGSELYRDEARMEADRATEASASAKEAAEDARRAAGDAQQAADKADSAAQKAEKAFELQLRK